MSVLDLLYKRSTSGTSRDETKFIHRLRDLVEEGQRHRDHYAPPADTVADLKLYRGEYVVPDKAKDRIYASANWIRAIINRQASMLTDNQPILRVEAIKAGLKKAGDMMTAIMLDEWEQQSMQRQTHRLVHTAALMRSAGLNCRWDKTRNQIAIEVIKPYQLSVDPRVEEAALINEAQYVDIKRVMPLAEVQMLWPVTGMAARANANLQLDKESEDVRAVKSAVDILYSKPRQQGHGEIASVDVHETFLTDIEMGKDPEKDSYNKRLYPTTRRIVWTEDVVLEDGPNPYWHGLPTVEWFEWSEDPMHIWGHSEPSYHRDLQLSSNQLLDELVQNKLLTNFVQISAPQDTVADDEWNSLREHLGSGAIMIRTLNNQSQISVQPPTAFGADDMAIATHLTSLMQLLSGITPATMGESPGSLQSGTALEGLIEGANQMNRERASRLEDFYKRFGFKMMATILQWFPSERVVSLSGPTGEAFEYTYARSEFFVKPTGQMNPETKQPEMEPMDAKDRATALRDFRLVIEPGSSMPGARQRRALLTRELMKMGAASREDVLVAAGWPPWIAKEMIRRANEDPAVQALMSKGKGSDPREKSGGPS